MEKVKLKALIDIYEFKKGDIVEVSKQLARQCLDSKNWEVVKEKVVKNK